MIVDVSAKPTRMYTVHHRKTFGFSEKHRTRAHTDNGSGKTKEKKIDNLDTKEIEIDHIVNVVVKAKSTRKKTIKCLCRSDAGLHMINS